MMTADNFWVTDPGKEIRKELDALRDKIKQQEIEIKFLMTNRPRSR